MNESNNLHKTYYPEIDFIKSFAILSVIILHILTASGSNDILHDLFSSFHISQAVPLFMLVFGFTFRLSIEKKHDLNKILSSRIIRLIFPLLIGYIMSFIVLFLFNITPEVSWHSLIGKLPLYGNGTYFITLYIETIIYFFILYYFVTNFHKYFVTVFSILFSILGELIAYTIDIHDTYMYSASIHRYALVVVLGYYLYDYINGKNDILIFLLGIGSIVLLAIYNINFEPIWPYNQYDSAKLWGIQHFPYSFYTVIYAGLIIKLYKIFSSEIFTKIIILIGQSSFHIFLIQIFVFNLRKFYSINIDIISAICILVLSVAIGIIWYKIENFILKIAQKNIEGQRVNYNAD